MQLPGNATITSSAIGIDNNQMIIMGCSDGNMYGVDLKGDKPLKVWSTDVRGALLKGRPTVVDNRIYAGCGDGKIYIFDSTKPGTRSDVIDLTDPDGGAGSIDADPLIVKNKLYVGANLRDAFYGVDLNNKRFWRVMEKDIGFVTKGAAIMGNLAFFNTESGKLFCVDAERGFLHWVYKMPNTRFASSPIVVGNRVYCFTTKGLILGFDEPLSER
jgi:outer membrane protein assembly factor BamB